MNFKDRNDFFSKMVEEFFTTPLEYRGKTKTNNNLLENRSISENLPSTNIVETKGDYQYELSTPGFTKKDITVNLTENVITIKGERTIENVNNDRDYLSKEFHSQKFSRTFNVPDNTVLDEIYAKVENGITTLYFPKEKLGKTKTTKRKIDII